MKALFKLLLKYVFASEALFILILMPLLFYLIMGEAMIFGLANITRGGNNVEHKIANSLIAGIGGTTIVSTAFTILPVTIVDFKNSVLMKRMGATNIQPFHFILSIILLFFIQSTFSFFYTRAAATLIFGARLGWTVAFQYNIGLGFLHSIPIMILAVALGLFITSISSTVRRAMTLSRMLYMPMSILSGGLVPISVIYSSTFLKSLSWLNPLKYAIEPYLAQQNAFDKGGTTGVIYTLSQWQNISYPFIVGAISILAIYFAIRKIKWTS